MATTEKNVLMRSKDSAGNSILYYPITKADNVDGLDAYVGSEIAANVVNPDWNQTDPTAKDYIKNRIIYKHKTGSVTVASGTLPATSDTEPSQLTISDETFTGFTEGESYQVTIDGVTSECIGQFLEGMVVIASFDIVDLYAGSVTDGWYAGYVNEVLMAAALGSYLGKTISIVRGTYDIKKLPADLLPDTVPTAADVVMYVEDSLYEHSSDTSLHITSDERMKWNNAADNAGDAVKSYADSGDTATLNSAKSYADSGDTATLNSAKSYADSGDTATLNSAKSYTDEQLAGLSQIQFITWGADD